MELTKAEQLLFDLLDARFNNYWNSTSDIIKKGIAKEIIKILYPKRVFEVNFGGHLKCKIYLSENELEVGAAVNGWGDGIPSGEIYVTESKDEE
jgi:hypothetical protein